MGDKKRKHCGQEKFGEVKMDLLNDSAEYWAQQEDSESSGKSESSDSDSELESNGSSDMTELEDSESESESDCTSQSESSDSDNGGPTAAKRSYRFHPRRIVETVNSFSESRFREMFRMKRGKSL